MLTRAVVAIATVASLLTSPRVVQAQACSGVPTGAATRVVALHAEGHAYGTSRFAVGAVKPLERRGAWVTLGLGRTSDPELLLRSLALDVRGDWAIRLPLNAFICPSAAARGATADDNLTDTGATATWLDTDVGLTVGREWRGREDRAVIVAIRGRTGETRARRTSPYSHTIDDRWDYQMLEAFVGLSVHTRFVIRPNVTYFRFGMSDPLSVLQPLARADREIGVGLLLGFVF